MYRPSIIARYLLLSAWTYPSARFLMGNDRIDILFCSCDQIVIFKEISERNKAVKPIRNTLPTFGISADPCAVSYVTPDLIKISRKSLGLNFKLTLQPAARLEFF